MTLLNPNLAHHLIPDLPDADALLPWLRQMDANRWYTNYGPLVLEFERQLSVMLSIANGGRHVALTSLVTGYHALEFGLRAFKLPVGSLVLMPVVTFPACPLAAIHAGLTPVFADVDAARWSLTPAIARRICERHTIQAIMPVAVYGVPLPVLEWDEFTREFNIPVIIDAAAAVETQKVPQQCLVAHSLHATKPFGIGEGGALAGSEANTPLVKHAYELSSFGNRDRIAYNLGSNGKMSEYHAAVGLAQMLRWPSIKERRVALLRRYRAALSGLPLSLQVDIDLAIPSLLMVACRGRTAAEVMDGLKARGIAAHQTYLPPLYHHPAFNACGVMATDGKHVMGDTSIEAKAQLCPGAEYMRRQVCGLPFHTFMGEEDIATVVGALREIF